MASLLPALRGTLGTTEYFLVTIKAKELVERATIPRELDGWHDLTVEEKYQREIDTKRVKKIIAPYLASDKDRFFGAIIIAMMNAESVEFEPISDVAKGLPSLYKQASSAIGLLTLSGGEILVPLDGQHRLKALKYAISAKDDEGRPIEDIAAPCTDLAQEDVAVILVRYEPVKARKIFNKVNRYAKPTSAAQNYITDDDDVVAVLTRKLVDEVFGSRMVELESNTLTKKASEFTTIATLYAANKEILEGAGQQLEPGRRPDKAIEKVCWHELEDVWAAVLTKIDVIAAVMHDKEETGDARRMEMREELLLGKPVAQLALIKAFVKFMHSHDLNGHAFSHENICARLNQIDWAIGAKHWQRIIMNGEKILSGKSVASLASDYIAYLAGCPFNADELADLTRRYVAQFPKEEQDAAKLPAPTVKP